MTRCSRPGWTTVRATIVGRADGTAHVAYFGGEEDDVGVTQLRRGVIGPKASLSANFEGKGDYCGSSMYASALQCAHCGAPRPGKR